MTINIVTQKRLKELLHYCPETGIFTRKIKPCNNSKIGEEAGHKTEHGYIRITIDRSRVMAHRLVWLYVTGAMPKGQIDHINHDRSDNRWENLRGVTQSENQRNARMRTANTSGRTGVYWNNKKNKWIAQIRLFDRNIQIGAFDDKSAAISAREKEEKAHGFHENHGKQDKHLEMVL